MLKEAWEYKNGWQGGERQSCWEMDWYRQEAGRAHAGRDMKAQRHQQVGSRRRPPLYRKEAALCMEEAEARPRFNGNAAPEGLRRRIRESSTAARRTGYSRKEMHANRRKTDRAR